MAKFNFDKRKLQKAVEQAAHKKLTTITEKLSLELNALTPTYRGRPVDEVKPAVQQVWRKHLMKDLPEPKLTEFAEQIAAGGTVRVTTTK